MDGGAWWATVHGVAKSRTQLSNFTFSFCMLFSSLFIQQRFIQDLLSPSTTLKGAIANEKENKADKFCEGNLKRLIERERFMLRKEKNSKYKEYHIHSLKTNMAKDDDKVPNSVHVIMYVTLCKHIFKIKSYILPSFSN